MGYRFTVFVREEGDFSSRVLYVTSDSAAEAVTVAACECRAHGYASGRAYYEVHDGVPPVGRAVHEETRAPDMCADCFAPRTPTGHPWYCDVHDPVAARLEAKLAETAERMEVC